jgi:hypothetical protein
VGSARRSYFDGSALDGIDFPDQARPGVALPLRYSGFSGGETMEFLLVPEHAINSIIGGGDEPSFRLNVGSSTAFSTFVEGATEEGPHALIALPHVDSGAVCGWLASPTNGCVVAGIDISGAALPEEAVNFDDQIALLEIELEQEGFTPGGQLPVTITWQGLAQIDEDYTVFVQVLDAADRIVGQVDAWPVQGTRPTSGWQPGDVITDPYVIRLRPDMPPGDYRLITGLYLLSTGQRLPVVDETGNPADDKVVVTVTPATQ